MLGCCLTVYQFAKPNNRFAFYILLAATEDPRFFFVCDSTQSRICRISSGRNHCWTKSALTLLKEAPPGSHLCHPYTTTSLNLVRKMATCCMVSIYRRYSFGASDGTDLLPVRANKVKTASNIPLDFWLLNSSSLNVFLFIPLNLEVYC